MPKQTSRSRTIRKEATLIGNVPAPSLRAGRRNLLAAGRGNTGPVREARALADAFDVGTDFLGNILERRARKAELAGTQAALEGRTPTAAEEKQDAFKIAHSAVITRAQMVEVEIEMADEWSKMDTQSWTARQTQAWASDRLLENFGGLDLDRDLDAATAALLQPWLEQQELTFLALNQSEQGSLLQRQNDVAFEITTRGAIVDGSYSLDELNKQIVGVYGPKATNGELFALLRGIAVEDGRPELIEELMEKKTWDGGKAPAPGGLREFDDKLIDALRQARATKTYNEQIGEREALNLHNKEQQQAGNDIMNTLIPKAGQATDSQASLEESSADDQEDNPTKALETLNAFQKLGTIDWQVAAKLRSAIHTYRNLSLGDDVPKWNEIWDLELKIASGTEGVDEVIAAGNEGVYGTGRVGQQQFTSAMARARAVENFRNNDPLFQSQMKEFTAQYTQSLHNEQQEPRIKQHRAKATVRLLALMDEGKTIDEAMPIILGDEKLKPKTVEEWAVLFGGAGASTKSAFDQWKLGTRGITSRHVMDARDRDLYPTEHDYMLFLLNNDDLEPGPEEARFRGEL